MKKGKGYFSISAVSNIVGLHQQTIRMYEREGLINPKRSDGNTRMFSEEDVELLEKIIYYTNKLGVNLAGVEIILKMQKRIDKMQNQMNTMFSNSKQELVEEEKEYTRKASIAHHEIKSIKDKKKKLNLTENSENIEKNTNKVYPYNKDSFSE